ncbi:Nif3-like dinuclear metal center hexameric protein [Lepagella muris]|uniref:Nif3-like dinuclear metal center hexameric protein n=1 Tax=Lepagella muris TaxID=3032870 RepID=A0AC61RF66_9BACT|nr:Nif3-like dinuclear metal center hexameric protein [Lepagella muris]ROT05589.1 Nif3-like dinuclear metal center hexameric protein [Muribaculaceae bacterium Isolate-037 (Harlan)]TGY78017.1 Nif3-like dinuclear metal center hexameric protein [Lepagella muris]THG51637.1 Nif3-like dinuclear metal center hexameric protein [Bacteroidales bacterium]TKC63233.1 Nif3-like dinuclear metal center hexameric protein [Bacteroidales bacterium]
MNNVRHLKVKDIAEAIENFAPKRLQESYDNAGLQVGDPEMDVYAALLCLDVTEDVLNEALERHCNLIISHHPLLFKGLKEVTGRTATERIVISAIKKNIAIYSAHTNLDSAWEGVSHEIAHVLNMRDLRVLEPHDGEELTGLGVVGNVQPTPKIEFLRKIKEAFKVKSLRYSSQSPQLVVRKVAVCGGAGASLIRDAINAGADMIITGDVKYHDFTTYGLDIIIADIGHYESELCTKKIFSTILKDRYPDFVTYFAESETNPVNYM